MYRQRQMVSERSAWKGSVIGGKEGLVYQFTPQHIEIMDGLMRKTRDVPVDKITREMFDHPALNPFLADVAEEMAEGKGAVVLRGPSTERYNDDELTRMFWGIGTHLGVAAEQNHKGDKIDHVRDIEDNPLGRRQYGTQELVFHTDGITGQNLGLLCLRQSKSGGMSRLVSALTIHNAFVENHPDLLEQLYEGFTYHRKGKQREGTPLLTPFPVPVFSDIDGIVSVQYIRDYMDKASEMMPGGMPPKMKQALDYFDECANSEGMNVNFMLELGEIMLVNNRAVLHSRTAFEDYPEFDRKRHLVRLWMNVPDGRPYKPEMDYLERAWTYKAAKSA
jgi:hypothetical protein